LSPRGANEAHEEQPADPRLEDDVIDILHESLSAHPWLKRYCLLGTTPTSGFTLDEMNEWLTERWLRRFG
jgi:hypothetical protein